MNTTPPRITSSIAARRWGVTRSLVVRWCSDGRIAGAELITDLSGRQILTMPVDAVRPERQKTGPKPTFQQ